MSLRRVLRSLPMRRQTVVAALLVATVLFIVYQFTFVAELSESNKPKHHQPNSIKRHVEKVVSRKHRLGKYKVHPKDVDLPKSEAEGDKVDGKDGHIKEEKKAGVAKKSEKSKGTSSLDLRANARRKDGAAAHISLTTFKCETSGKVISQDKVNDDYCDCPEDGSDEPRTNACVNGRFMCLKHVKNFPQSIPSGWVNDGFCDCCDGSDEWKMKKVDTSQSLQLQKKIGQYLSPCLDHCPDSV